MSGGRSATLISFTSDGGNRHLRHRPQVAETAPETGAEFRTSDV
jgi:hypothetical protein